MVYHVESMELASKWVIKRVPFDFYLHCQQVPPEYFKRLNRVTKNQFFTLNNIISPDGQRQQRLESDNIQAVSPELILSITLRTLASRTYLDISWPIIADNFLHILTSRFARLGEATAET